MLIAQLTDIHIGFDPKAKPEELNVTRFRATLERVLDAPNRPDMLILSGDLTDQGDRESFDKVQLLLQNVECPIYPAMGNHDTREELLRAFPDTPSHDGFVQYAIERDGLRIVILDTYEPGRHGGAFCESRKAWLKGELSEHSDTPTVIFMHHPPVVAGIGWMDPSDDESWMTRFAEAVTGHKQILAIHCGHLHRPVNTAFAGIPLSVTPSVAPPVAMDLRPMSPDVIDGRSLITTEAPSYALHLWENGLLVSHYERAEKCGVLAAYTSALQPMIREMFAERQ